MVWVGSFKSLQSALHRPCFRGAPLEVHTWVGTDIGLISSLVDWLMSLIAASRRVAFTGKRSSLNLRFGIASS